MIDGLSSSCSSWGASICYSIGAGSRGGAPEAGAPPYFEPYTQSPTKLQPASIHWKIAFGRSPKVVSP